MIINILFFGFISRVIGGMFTKTNPLTGELENAVPRFVSMGVVIIALGFNYMMQPMMIIPMLAAFCVIRLLPTSPLFSAIHGQAPTRSDGRWQLLQDWTFRLWRTLPEKYQSWRAWGCIYGAVRCSLLIPLAVVNLWLLIFLGLGGVYYASGAICRRFMPSVNPMMIAEVTVGCLFGLIV